MNSIDEIVCEPDSKHRDNEVGENFKHNKRGEEVTRSVYYLVFGSP